MRKTRCVISFFYIKPQRAGLYNSTQAVVLYLSSTSNHNTKSGSKLPFPLCYIFLLHQTTTRLPCTLIKRTLCYIFLLHQTTTIKLGQYFRVQLCYIFLLHQTTTTRLTFSPPRKLCYIFLLHQTTTLPCLVKR